MTMDMNVQQRGSVRVESSTSLVSTSSSSSSSSSSGGTPNASTSPPPAVASTTTTSSPDTPAYSPSLPTTTTPLPPPLPATRSVKRSFDVAFLMAPDENLAAKKQQQQHQLRLVTTSSLMDRPSSPIPPPTVQSTTPPSSASPSNSFSNFIETPAVIPPRTYQDHHLLGGMVESPLRHSHIFGGLDVLSRGHNQRLLLGSQHGGKSGLYDHSSPGLLVQKTGYLQDDLIERDVKCQNGGHKSQDLLNRPSFHHDEVSPKAIGSKVQEISPVMIRSAFTKVTTASKFDSGHLLSVPTSPSSVSTLSGGGLSPDHVAYQGSMSPPAAIAPPSNASSATANTSPVPSHFLQTQTPPKSFTAAGMPILSPGQPHHPHHLSPNSASSASSKALATSYSSAAFLLHQQDMAASAKHIKVNNGLVGSSGAPACTSGSVVPTNGGFRNEIDNYLMKASITAANQQHNQHPLYSSSSAHEKDLISGFSTSKLRSSANAGMLYPHADSVAAYSTLAAAAATYPFAANFSTAELLVTARGAPPPPSTASLLTAAAAAANPAAAAAAAVVSASLLPPSFAALSLPAQNVCAKCNISFRMTSDLVYHMRSHHKGDHFSGDLLRRRREQEKLKCPVCSESFRERHHLTRHMTAHQDKEGDMVDDGDDADRTTSGDADSGAVSTSGRRRSTASAVMVASGHAAAK